MSNDGKNKPTVIIPQIADTTTEWAASTTPIPLNVLALDTDKRIIKIGDGNTPFKDLSNHTHEGQYSDITHGHYFGYGEKWFRHQPKLWFRKDLPNHPELIELNGGIISDERMYRLVDAFDSDVDLIHANKDKAMLIRARKGNDDFTVLFGPDIDLHNTNDLSDQYETDEFDIEFKSDDEYTRILHSYTFVANRANELHPMADVISPKVWELWATLDVDDRTERIAVGTNDTPMYPNEKRVYVLDAPVKFKKLVIFVKEWHYPKDYENIQMKPGLRRLYLHGRIDCAITLPDIKPIHPDYAWVVPLDDIGIGLKHEDIGDIGVTATLPSLLPKNRLLRNGGRYEISRYPELYGRLMQSYAPQCKPTTSIEESPEWTVTIDNKGTIVAGMIEGGDNELVLDIHFSTPHVLGAILVSYLEPTNIGTFLKINCRSGDKWIEDIKYEMHNEVVVVSEHNDGREVDQIRIRAREWMLPLRKMDGVSVKVYASPSGYFHIPNAIDTEGTPYIVAETRVSDVASNTILSLQQVIADLQNQMTKVADRLVTAEATIHQLLTL